MLIEKDEDIQFLVHQINAPKYKKALALMEETQSGSNILSKHDKMEFELIKSVAACKYINQIEKCIKN